MSESSARRPLALTATLATSVAAAAGMITPAHATTASPGGTAHLTVSGGTSGPSTSTTVAGTKYALDYAPQAKDLSWAPTGARAAWIDPASNAVLTGVPGGETTMIAPAPANGTVREHPTWLEGGARVVWEEKDPGNDKNGKPNQFVLKWAFGSGLDKDSSGTPNVYDLWGLAGADVLHPDAVGAMLVFQVNQAGKPQVFAWDQSKPNSSPYKVADGWAPSLSPDGARIAFVSGGNIYTVGSGNPGATLAAPSQVTASATPLEQPVWTPDGKGLVFQVFDNTSKDVDTQTVSASASKATSFTQVIPGTHVLGVPAFQPLVKSHVVRLAGTDRLDTAIKTSQSQWGTAGSGKGTAAKAVVLSRSDQFADALGGSALAAKVGGPLLMTPTAGLAPQVQAEIQRVLGAGDGKKTVYVLGGEKALSPAVANALSTLHYNVQRVAGDDRYSTAVKIAETITGGADKAPDDILVATGQNFPDALSAGAAAGAINAHEGQTAVVLLTNDATMPQATAQYLAPLLARTNLNRDGSKPANFIELDSVGGKAELALNSHWIPIGYQPGQFHALTGLTRYETSFKVATYFFGQADAAGLATGMNWADALSGGAEMGTVNGPLLLVDPAGKGALPPGAAAWLHQDAGQFTQLSIFGGNAAVPAGVDKTAGGLIAGPGGVDYAANPNIG